MNKALRKLYTFLFLKHDIGFCRFCYAMLIPCAFSHTICEIWMWVLIFVMALSFHARTKGWDRGEEDD